MKRLRVLISAYACEPGKGSEPEVGWQWALQMARFHDVTVLTRENNRSLVEKELERRRGQQPLPAFVYHDLGGGVLDFKRQTNAVKAYYVLWQRSAHDVVAQQHRIQRFELLHHVTFAGFRYPTAIWGHGVPTIWGPVGGMESVRWSLLPWRHPKSLIAECARGLHNFIQAAPHQALARRAAMTTTILASTPEMRQKLARLGFPARIMPTIGLDTGALPARPRPARSGALKLLFVGNIITLKGVDLALCALEKSQSRATLTLIGDGNYLASARRLVKKLGLEDRVFFQGRLSREKVLESYRDFDVFLFPGLHDTGGYAVIEAMFNELPVICLDCGGPSVAVGENCGIKIPVGARQSVIAQLAEAIRSYDQNPGAIREQGRAAREAIFQNYDWPRKGEEMNKVYEQTMTTL